MIRALCFSVLLLACTPKASGPSLATTASVQTGAATGPAAARVTEVVALRSRYVSIDAAKNEVRFSPGSDRQQASYTTYFFDLGEFTKLAAGDKNAKLRVEILSKGTRSYTPPDNMPSPMGGFRYTDIRCRILGVEP